MDLFPLWNSLRVAAISTVIVFFAGVFAAYYICLLYTSDAADEL